MGILIFKGLTARCLYKSFGVKGLILVRWVSISNLVLGAMCSKQLVVI
jgi:hypothetical protein